MTGLRQQKEIKIHGKYLMYYIIYTQNTVIITNYIEILTLSAFKKFKITEIRYYYRTFK